AGSGRSVMAMISVLSLGGALAGAPWNVAAYAPSSPWSGPPVARRLRARQHGAPAWDRGRTQAVGEVAEQPAQFRAFSSIEEGQQPGGTADEHGGASGQQERLPRRRLAKQGAAGEHRRQAIGHRSPEPPRQREAGEPDQAGEAEAEDDDAGGEEGETDAGEAETRPEQPGKRRQAAIAGSGDETVE